MFDKVCAECNGNGTYFLDGRPDTKCDKCGGSGAEHHLNKELNNMDRESGRSDNKKDGFTKACLPVIVLRGQNFYRETLNTGELLGRISDSATFQPAETIPPIKLSELNEIAALISKYCGY